MTTLSATPKLGILVPTADPSVIGFLRLPACAARNGTSQASISGLAAMPFPRLDLSWSKSANTSALPARNFVGQLVGNICRENVLKEGKHVQHKESRFRGCGRSPEGD